MKIDIDAALKSPADKPLLTMKLFKEYHGKSAAELLVAQETCRAYQNQRPKMFRELYDNGYEGVCTGHVKSGSGVTCHCGVQNLA